MIGKNEPKIMLKMNTVFSAFPYSFIKNVKLYKKGNVAKLFRINIIAEALNLLSCIKFYILNATINIIAKIINSIHFKKSIIKLVSQ